MTVLSSIRRGRVITSMVSRARWAPRAEGRALNITTTDLPGDIVCIALDGRLDAAGADAIGISFTAATAAQGRPVVVDLSGVSFIASLGIRLLIANARALMQKGVTMVLYGAHEQVASVLRDTAIDQLIPCVDTQAEAVARATA
jgi:anti-anti-sigma factor